MTAGRSPAWSRRGRELRGGGAAARLRAVAPRRRRAPGTPEIVVVDNGSSDGSVAALRAAVPTSTWSTPARNLGYAARGQPGHRGHDVGAVRGDRQRRPRRGARHRGRAARARLDAEPDLAAVGPALLNPDGSQYPSARVARVDHRRRRPRRARSPVPRATPSPVATASSTRRGTGPATSTGCRAALLFLRRSALDSVGGWDERYFMYMEDVDLCWRLRRHRLAGRVRPLGSRHPRAGGEHGGAPVPDDRRAPPLGVPVRGPAVAGPEAAAAPPRGLLPRGACRRRHGGAGAEDPLRAAQGQRVTCHTPCPSPGPAISAPPCAPGTASRSASAAGPSGGTSRSRCSVIVGVVAVFLVRVVGQQRGQRAAAAHPTRRPTCPATTGTPRSRSNICGEWLARSRSSRSRPTTRASRPTSASTPTATT